MRLNDKECGNIKRRNTIWLYQTSFREFGTQNQNGHTIENLWDYVCNIFAQEVV